MGVVGKEVGVCKDRFAEIGATLKEGTVVVFVCWLVA